MADSGNPLAQVQQLQAKALAAARARERTAANAARAIQTDRMLGWYSDQLARHGTGPLAVGWENEQTQLLRFAVLTGALLAEGTLLDVGCGHGHFADFLEAQGRRFEYTGLELHPEHAAAARERLGDEHVREGDVSTLEEERAWDFVVASGVFNIRVADDPAAQLTYVTGAIDRMYRAAAKGIAFNLMSTHAPTQVKDQPFLALYDPLVVLHHCFRLSPWVELKHTYLPHDFTVYVYRGPEELT